MSDPVSQPSPPRSERILLLPPDKLLAGPNAPAVHPVLPAALIESVRTYGVLQPLLVRQAEEGFEVLAGFRRWAAAKEVHLAEVPVRVYRVEDSALSGFYAASNLQGERRRVSPPGAAGSGSGEPHKPVMRLNGLLDEELNQTVPRTPFKAILSLAAIVLLFVWAGLNLSRCVRNRPERVADLPETPAAPGEQVPAVTVPPAPDRPPAARPQPASPPQAGPAAAGRRMTVEDWRRILAGIDGIEVRDVNGFARVIFLNPVFSRLTTIDPAQHTRLNRVAQAIHEACDACILVVIGHTTNVPVRQGGAFESNDHLGELRANEVVTHLTTRAGIPATRLRPISSGDRDPPFPNTPPSNQARNVTVTIEIQAPRDR